MQAKCIGRVKNDRGQIVYYNIQYSSGKVETVPAVNLKEKLRKFPNMVSNLVLARDGRVLASDDIPTTVKTRDTRDIIKNALYKASISESTDSKYWGLAGKIVETVELALDGGASQEQIYAYLIKCANGIYNNHTLLVNRLTAVANNKNDELGFSFRISNGGIALMLVIMCAPYYDNMEDININSIGNAENYRHCLELIKSLKSD